MSWWVAQFVPRVATMIALAAVPLYSQVKDQGAPEWKQFGNNAQHGAISAVSSQSAGSIHWKTPVDLNPSPTSSGSILAHYGSPVVTARNTVIVPVKTGAAGGFEIQTFNGATGALLYALPTDYEVPQPPSSWIPPYQPTLSLGTRLYWAGAGGTIYYRDLVDNPREIPTVSPARAVSSASTASRCITRIRRCSRARFRFLLR
jgi:hypothetical protein